MAELAVACGCSSSHIGRILKLNGVKPSRVEGRKKLYDSHVEERLKSTLREPKAKRLKRTKTALAERLERALAPFESTNFDDLAAQRSRIEETLAKLSQDHVESFVGIARDMKALREKLTNIQDYLIWLADEWQGKSNGRQRPFSPREL